MADETNAGAAPPAPASPVKDAADRLEQFYRLWAQHCAAGGHHCLTSWNEIAKVCNVTPPHYQQPPQPPRLTYAERLRGFLADIDALRRRGFIVEPYMVDYIAESWDITTPQLAAPPIPLPMPADYGSPWPPRPGLPGRS